MMKIPCCVFSMLCFCFGHANDGQRMNRHLQTSHGPQPAAHLSGALTEKSRRRSYSCEPLNLHAACYSLTRLMLLLSDHWHCSRGGCPLRTPRAGQMLGGVHCRRGCCCCCCQCCPCHRSSRRCGSWGSWGGCGREVGLVCVLGSELTQTIKDVALKDLCSACNTGATTWGPAALDDSERTAIGVGAAINERQSTSRDQAAGLERTILLLAYHHGQTRLLGGTCAGVKPSRRCFSVHPAASTSGYDIQGRKQTTLSAQHADPGHEGMCRNMPGTGTSMTTHTSSVMAHDTPARAHARKEGRPNQGA